MLSGKVSSYVRGKGGGHRLLFFDERFRKAAGGNVEANAIKKHLKQSKLIETTGAGELDEHILRTKPSGVFNGKVLRAAAEEFRCADNAL